MLNKEEFFIKQFKSKYIGDDGAVINYKNSTMIYSMDSFVENVHFKSNWFTPFEIAQKSMIVNLSDAIVMGAIPKYALISISIPRYFNKIDIISLVNGFKNIEKTYKIQIIGGDTIVNDTLDIHITIISTINNKILFRKGAKKNFLIAYTNNLGTTKKDLKRLFQNKKIKKTSKFIKPKLQIDFLNSVKKHITTCTDISDGLDIELERFSKINKLGIKLFKNYKKNIMCSAEEYEILFSFNKNKLYKIRNLAKKHKIKLNIIGKIIRNKYKAKCKNFHIN